MRCESYCNIKSFIAADGFGSHFSPRIGLLICYLHGVGGAAESRSSSHCAAQLLPGLGGAAESRSGEKIHSRTLAVASYLSLFNDLRLSVVW